MIKLFSISICALFFLTACDSTQRSSDETMGNLLLAEPEPVNPRSQMAIARYNHILAKAPLKSEERAELLFQRGVLYDSVGLAGLARYDYGQALQLKPDMAEAYNSMGIHHIQQMDFMQAYEAFDSSLDLNPDYEFALLNRGIALYYGGRAELAVDDIQAFHAKDVSDPYRAIWTYIVQSEVSKSAALEQLAVSRKTLLSAHWANSIVDFYLGKTNERQVIASLLEGVSSQKQLNDRLCEAYFYLGKYHSDLGNSAKAANYFKLALSTNVFEYVEHRYARIELSLLRQDMRSDFE